MWEIGKKSNFKDESVQFVTNSQETREKSKGHVWSIWLKVKESCQAVKLGSTLQEGPSREVLVKHSVWQKDKVIYQILYSHYKYSPYPWIVSSAFQRENPSKYIWELEIVIPTIIYTFPLGFPLLLLVHLYILKRLLAQTLTTPNLSIEWNFGAIGKYWKEPFSGGCNLTELWGLES